MIPVLTAAVILVGAVAATAVLLCFAILRRLAALQNSGVGGATPGAPAPGHKIGDFRVDLLAGGEFTADRLRQEPAMVLFLSPHCEPCKKVIAELKQMPVPLSRPMYVMIAGEAQDEAVLAVAADMPDGARVGAISHQDDIMRAFTVDGYPTIVTTADGTVLASGLRLGEVLDHAHA